MRADPWQYVEDVMGVRLGHLVTLLESSHSGALPFPRNVDPRVDLRWLFVGYSVAPVPQRFHASHHDTHTVKHRPMLMTFGGCHFPLPWQPSSEIPGHRTTKTFRSPTGRRRR